MRRALVCLTLMGILLGCLAASASAGWVWRDGRWIYIDTTEPALPPIGNTPTPTAPTPTPTKATTPSASATVTPSAGTPAPSTPDIDVPPPPIMVMPPPTITQRPPPNVTQPPPPELPTTTLPGKGVTAPSPRAQEASRLSSPQASRNGDQESSSWWSGWRSKPLDPNGDKPLFQEGQAAYDAKHFSAAIGCFDKIINDYAISPYREEAMWLRAGALLETKELYAAYTQLEDLITNYAGSPHYPDALTKEVEIGDRFLAGEHRRVWGLPLMIGAETEGLEILRRVYEHQPAGGLADAIVMKIADYHWAHREWQESEDYYDKYCREFPNGKSAQRAELQRAKCAIERCRGPRYDVTCLQLAIDRLKQFQQKFPQAAAQEGVPELLVTLRDRQAQALYEIAARYYRGGQPLAAAHYAESLRQKYPESPWSDSAGRFLGVASPPAPEPAMEEPSK